MDREELINGYFEGSLSESQLAEFEVLLGTDEAFRTAYEFEKELQVALKKEERKEIKELFSSLNENEEPGPEKRKSRLISMRPWLMAASIALVVGLGSWMFFFTSPNINSEQLYLTHFAPYENVVHPIERGNQLEDLQSRAFTAYEEENYNKALQLFKELNIKQNDSYIDFYEAIVLMQLNQHKESVVLLKSYIENDGELTDRAHWYLALAYLKLDNIKDSKKELKKLIALGSFKNDSAKRLLTELQ